MTDIFATEPDFVNEEDVKWWQDKDTTRYAHKRDRHGTSLPDVVCWYVEQPNGVRTRVLIDNKAGKILYEHQSLEAVAVHIDMLKFLKRDNAKK